MADWEYYANRNAEFFILTHRGVEFSTPEGQAYFFRSGEDDAGRLLSRIENLLPGRDRCVDLGCGVGRLALPHAESFKQVYAVDISPTMLAKLRITCQRRAINNIEPFLAEDRWDEEQAADYIYSVAVLQHISEFGAITEYLQRIRRALKPRGIAQLHFDTRPRNFLYHARNLLPDALLPSVYQRGLRRIRRSPAELMTAFSSAGLNVLQANGVATDQTFYLLTPV